MSGAGTAPVGLHELHTGVVVIEWVRCPYCGYRMPVTFDKDAVCKGVFVKCKGKNCRRVFEIRLGGKPSGESGVCSDF